MSAIYAKYGDASHEELVLAEDLGAQLVKQEPTNANAWAAYAHATLARVQFDVANEEYPAALSRAQRSASLEADGFEPRFALASVYALRSVTRADGVRMLRKLADEKPDDVRVALSLARGLSDGGDHSGAFKALTRPGAAAEKSPYVWNLRSGILMVQMRLDEAVAAIDQSIALHVGPVALMQRGYIQVFLQDDYRAAAETISSIPGSFLIRENETWSYGWFWLNHRNPEKSLARWRAFDGDFVLSHPKGYYVGRALEMSGRLDAAKFEWRAALRLVESKLATEPDSKLLLCWKAMLAACLEEKEKSQQALAVVRALEVNGTNAYLVPLVLARLGRNDEAIAELSARWEKLGSNTARFARTIILHEALFDPLRDDERFRSFVGKIRRDPLFPIPEAKPAVTPIAPDEKAVAVLPFKNLSLDKEQEYFSDGLTEEILNGLARERDLRVPGVTSSFSFKGKSASPAEIAAALNVSRLVEGSVQRSGSQVRIRVSLTRVADNASEELGTFTYEMTDIFKLYDEVTRAVVQKLTKRQSTKSVDVLTTNSAAYDFYLRGRALQTRSVTSSEDAIPFFRKAVAADPNFALGWTRLAEVLIRPATLGQYLEPEREVAARSAVARALALQPNSPEALIARATFYPYVDTDAFAAARDVERAEAMAPPTAELRFIQWRLAAEAGNWDIAARRASESAELDPQNGGYLRSYAVYFSRRGDYAKADRLYVKMFAVSDATTAEKLLRMSNRFRWRGAAGASLLLDKQPLERDERELIRLWLLGCAGRADEARMKRAELIDGVAGKKWTAALADSFSNSGSGRFFDVVRWMGTPADVIRVSTAQQKLARTRLAEGGQADTLYSSLAQAEIGLGNRAAAEDALHVIREHSLKIPVYARSTVYYLAVPGLYAQLGNRDEAIAILRRAQEEGFQPGYSLRDNPDLVSLRNDPRFQELMQQAEAWAKAQPDPTDL